MRFTQPSTLPIIIVVLLLVVKKSTTFSFVEERTGYYTVKYTMYNCPTSCCMIDVTGILYQYKQWESKGLPF